MAVIRFGFNAHIFFLGMFCSIGKPFMYVNATDLDDPATPNGQLTYQIVMQLPKVNDVMYFQINNKTGAISLTWAGKSGDALRGPTESKKGPRSVSASETFPFLLFLLSIGSQELDPVKNPSYNLVVSVKDMGDQPGNSFSDSVPVVITVKENIWKAPEPVEIVENSTDPHPIKITQVVPKEYLQPTR